jgi:hypothetical protein
VTAKRITQINLDIEETFTIRRSTGSIQAHCQECGALSALVTLSEAATLLDVAAEVIAGEIESGRLHCPKAASGAVLICFESLQKAALHLMPRNFNLHINPSKENSK